MWLRPPEPSLAPENHPTCKKRKETDTGKRPVRCKLRDLIDRGLILLIFLQWFLVGGFPLTQFVPWWREPGIVVTVGTVLSGLSVMIPSSGYDSFATGPVLLAWFAWLWWLGLLVWKTALMGWRRVKLTRRS